MHRTGLVVATLAALLCCPASGLACGNAVRIVHQDRKRLAYVRYQGGVDTQLNALDADRDLFQAELTLAQIRYAEQLSLVELYKALGGGWQ